MYVLNIANSIKKTAVNEPREPIFDNFYRRIGFSR